MNDLIINKLKDIKQLENNIKLVELEHTGKRGKHYVFSKYSLPIVLLRDIQEWNLSVEDAGEEQSKLVSELKVTGKINY